MKPYTNFLFLCVGIAEVQHAAIAQDIIQLSQSQQCGTGVNGIHAFTIPCNSPKGPIILMHIQFDANRAVPFTSTTFHDSMNKNQTVSRIDNFRTYNCSELPVPSMQPECKYTFKMTPEQQSFSGYTSYDRGHLTPVNPYRFDFTAQDATFYCVNVAPQEPRTNQGPWSSIEQKVLGRPEVGYVMTGLCSDINPDGATNASYTVPSCYFKMFCYKDGSNAVVVVGFIGENSLYDRNNELASSNRSLETRKVRSQSEILERFGGDVTLIHQTWLDSEKVLLTNREAEQAPDALSCAEALTLSDIVKAEWTS